MSSAAVTASHDRHRRSPLTRRAWVGAIAIVVAVAASRSAVAQSDTGSTAVVARTFELRPREGLARQFDDGYRRHLDWHVGAGDRWAWYLWEVTNGERADLYVDGTFGHAPADFDAAVDPSGDGANNEVNVEPFVVRAANHLWRLRPDLSGAPVDLEAAPLVLHTEFRVRAGARPGFDAALGRLRTASGPRPYSVYELMSGGDPRTYVLWVPVASWAEAGVFAERTASVTRALADGAERVRAELWRFRPDLSLCRTAAAHCHRTLPPR